MVMRAKKNFIVVAYDISDDKRRGNVVKILEKAGSRVNYSVFECFLTDARYKRLQEDILSRIKIREDTVIFYPVCMDCYTKIVYLSASRRKFDKVTVI